MPLVIYKNPPFYDFVKALFELYYIKMVEPGLLAVIFGNSILPHLEIRSKKGSPILAEIYSNAVVLPDSALEYSIRGLAKKYEDSYSQEGNPVVITMDCRYEKPLPNKKKV